MVKSKDEILTAIRDRIGDDTSDSALSLLEDVTDTITDFESKAKGDGKDWKAEAERIEKEWREKYKARFFGGEEGVEKSETIVSDEPDEKNYTFESLFEEVKK